MGIMEPAGARGRCFEILLTRRVTGADSCVSKFSLTVLWFYNVSFASCYNVV